MQRIISFAVLSAALAAAAQDTQYPPKGEQIPAPACMILNNASDTPKPDACAPNAHQLWLRDLQHWRAERPHSHRL